MAYIMNTLYCTLNEFSTKLLKQQKQLHFLLDHISLYRETAA